MSKKNSLGSRLFMGLVFFFLYAPILLLIIFSFNEGNSSAVWKGFSLKWYSELFRDRLIMESVYTTLRSRCWPLLSPPWRAPLPLSAFTT